MSEFPSQTKNRAQWVLDVVREDQSMVEELLGSVLNESYDIAALVLKDLHKMDRDALLVPGGILTDKQIKLINLELK